MKTFNHLDQQKFVFVSINRFERKKNIELAIESFSLMLEKIEQDENCDKQLPNVCHLIIMGGYDTKVRENVKYADELENLAKKMNLQDKITFVKSPSDRIVAHALMSCYALLYTPSNEHFGIVPLEAMYFGCPVIAVNSGGPLETIVHKVTGFLTYPDPDSFSTYMKALVNSEKVRTFFSIKGKEHVQQNFNETIFWERLSSILKDL